MAVKRLILAVHVAHLGTVNGITFKTRLTTCVHGKKKKKLKMNAYHNNMNFCRIVLKHVYKANPLHPPTPLFFFLFFFFSRGKLSPNGAHMGFSESVDTILN